MSKSDDDILKDQIGDMGGLGKLQRIPGQQEELSDGEKKSLDDFKKNLELLRPSRSNDIKDGWIPIDRSDMGIRSLFYPEDWEFRIQPASVEAIRNWSSIDETSLYAVNRVLNEIIRTCVSIYSEHGKQSWDKINSWDRLWFVLKVREYTFKNGEQALEFDEECDNCGANIHYTLRSENLYYEYPDQNIIDQHWDQNAMVWTIDPKDYDLDAPKILKFYTPTIQKENAVLEWIYNQQEAGKHIDDVFIKFLPSMLERAPKDYNLLERYIKECQHTFNNWDTDMFLFADEIRRNITVEPSEKLVQKCPDCGEEVKSTMRFPKGIKYLFAVQSRHRKFGSK